MVSLAITSGSRAKLEPTNTPSLRSPYAVSFQAQLELRDLAGLVIGQQPIVRVAAVVAVEHDPHVVVDRVRILQRFSRTHEFRLAVGSQPANWVMVVSVTMRPPELTPKSSSLVMMPGNPSIKMRWPCWGTMSKIIRQRSPSK